MNISAQKLFVIIAFIPFLYTPAFSKPGDLDSSFGENGVVRTSVEMIFSNQNSSIILDNGNIIVASHFEYYFQSRGVQLLCYKPDGSLNENFGNDGRILTECGYWNDFKLRYRDPFTIKLQNKNKLIVAGLSVTGDPDPLSTSMLLIRYNLDGLIDSTFGIDGKTKCYFTDRCNEILNIELQSDGKIIALAAIDTTSSLNKIFIFKHVLIRFTVDGKLDSSFGINGIVEIDKFQIDRNRQPMLILKDNSIIISGNIKIGEFGEYYDYAYYALCKYDKDGKYDDSFGQDGLLKIYFSDYRRLNLSDILLVNNEELLICDYYYSKTENCIGLAKCDINGSLKSEYGNYGKLFFQIPYDYIVKDVILQQNKMIACGMIWDTAFVTRLTLDGITDSTFGNNGYIFIPHYQAINAHLYDNHLITTGSFHDSMSTYVLAKFKIEDANYVDHYNTVNRDLLISPNPILESAILSIFIELHGLLSVKLYDMNGVLVQDNSYYCALNEYPIQIKFHRDKLVRSGRYLLVISDQSELTSTLIEID